MTPTYVVPTLPDGSTATVGNTGYFAVPGGSNAKFYISAALPNVATGLRATTAANASQSYRYDLPDNTIYSFRWCAIAIESVALDVESAIVRMPATTGTAFRLVYTTAGILCMLSGGNSTYYTLKTGVAPGTKYDITMVLNINTVTPGASTFTINGYLPGTTTKVFGPITSATANFGTNPISYGDWGPLSTSTTLSHFIELGAFAYESGSTTEIPPYTIPVVPPTLTGTMQASDDFTGADNAPPAAQWTVTLAGATPGTAKILANRVVLTPGVGAYSAAVTSMWLTGCPFIPNSDWDILATLTPDSTLRQQYMVLGMSTNGSIRSGDTLPGNGYGLQIFPSSNGFNLSRITSGSVVNLMGSNGTYTFTAGTPVCARIQRVSSTNTINLWIWNLGTQMPTTPTWSGTDSAPLTGQLKPLLSASNGSSTTAIPATFDDFSVAATSATQGWFVSDGTKWNHYTLYVSNGTAWIAAPASETA